MTAINPVLLVFLFVVSLLFVFFITSFFFRRKLSRRVEALTRAVLHHAKEDFSAPVRIGLDDPLKPVADAVNRMTSSLRNKMEEVEGKEVRISTILDHMAEGVIAFDRQKRILIINPSAENMLGIRAKQMIGESLIGALRNSKIDELAEEAIRHKTALTYEMESAGPAPRIIKVDITGASGSDPIRGILILYDVTEMRRLEHMRRDFVANVSHELKTPLTSIKGFIETLLSGALRRPEQSEKFLRMMEEDADRLKRLIESLLELSRIESKETKLHLEVLDAREEASKAIAAFEPMLGEKHILIENHIPAGNRVRADRDKLKQIFVNLIDNAVKFNREGGKVVLDAAEEGRYVRLSVADTGIGIPPEDLPRVFERFFRVDKARSREMGGTGLGLAIVKHLAEAHGGDVSCSSTAGKGSVFSFTLEQAG